jgi:MoaA/NifB/PqqE/SkfB family radical SAM enzyme
MCHIWKTRNGQSSDEEWTLTELDDILSDTLFSKLEYININGGEPNLRNDLVEMVELFVSKFPRLKTITMNSNGLPTQRALSNVELIGRICQENDIRFSVSISLHDLGQNYDDIAGIPDAYQKVLETLRLLKKKQASLPFYLGVNCVITDLNIDHLTSMVEWSKSEGIPINFTLGEVRERFHNLDSDVMKESKATKKAELLTFLRSLSQNKSLFNQHAYRYQKLADMIEFGTSRKISCHYAMGGVILGSEGDLYYCKDSKSLGNCREQPASAVYFSADNLSYRNNELIQSKCKSCPPNTFNRIELEKDLLKYLKFLLSRKSSELK